MPPELPRRPKRNPFSAAEVAEIIASRKKREHLRLLRFKKSREYKIMNVFNVACFCIYLEIILCFYGPSDYEYYSYSKLTPHYRAASKGEHDLIAGIDVVASDGKTYNFLVKDDRTVPAAQGEMMIGEDFILQKDLKGIFPETDTSFRLFAASPVLFLCTLVLVVSFVAFCY